MFTGLPVWYIPWRYVSTHNHTTMENQRMSWRCVKNGAKQDISPPGFISLGCRCVLCVYLGSLSCPCWDPWPRPSSYIREAWKRALGHLERPISSQRTGYREVLREDGDWETVWETTGRVDEWAVCAGEGEGTEHAWGGAGTSKANVTGVLFLIYYDNKLFERILFNNCFNTGYIL